MYRLNLKNLCILAVVAVLGLTPTFAKTEGSLSGVCKDAQGAPLPGVTVKVESPDLLGGSRSTTSDSAGFYRFPSLPPGTYKISAELFGFKKLEKEGLQIQINQPATYDPVLGPEGVEIAIEVRTHEDIVQPEKTQTSTALNNEFVDNIPVLGRAYQTLLLLAPGVVNQDGNGFFGSGNVMSHGARSDANQYLFDGGNTTDTNLGTFGTNFNQDAVDQIEVITAGYKAEYGKSDGAISNILTKSGGNQFEGSFRFDIRDSSLDKHGSGKQEFQTLDFYRRYYSFTLGGPFIKDRFWFFASLYFQDRKVVSKFAGGAFEVQERPAQFWDYFAKLTYQINDDHQLVFSFHHDPATIHNAYANGDFPPSYRLEQYQAGKFYLLKESAVFSPSVLLESLVYITDGQVLKVHPDSDAPSSNVPFRGHDDGTDEFVGDNPSNDVTNRDRNQFREDLSVYKDNAMGTHDMKFGIGYELEFANADYRTKDYWDLLYGVPQKKYYSQQDPRFGPRLSSHARDWSLYVQDSWSPKQGLTLNLGIRGDMQQLEFNGFTGSDQWYLCNDPTGATCFTQDDAHVTIDTIKNVGVAPRLGFSWDPQNNGKNVIRASASRFYTVLPGFAGGWDAESKLSLYSCDTNPDGTCVTDKPPELTLFYLDRDVKFPYTDEATVGYEREIISELAVGVTVIYRKGTDILQDTDPNTYYTNVDPVGLAGVKNHVNENFDTLFVLSNNNESKYQALELTVRKRLSDNWQVLGSYTYSKAKGDGEWSATVEGDDARLIPFQYSFLPYDQRHIVKIDGTYFLPLDFIVSASARYYTGTPYTIGVKNFRDLNGDGMPECDPQNTDKSTCETDRSHDIGGGVHYFGTRNGHRNDNYFNLDLRAEKDFVFKGITLGIFGDVFNVLNNQATINTSATMAVGDPDCSNNPAGQTCNPPGTISKSEDKRFGRQFQLGFRINF